MLMLRETPRVCTMVAMPGLLCPVMKLMSDRYRQANFKVTLSLFEFLQHSHALAMVPGST